MKGNLYIGKSYDEMTSTELTKIVKERRFDEYERLWDEIPEGYESAMTAEEICAAAGVHTNLLYKLFTRGQRNGYGMHFRSDYLPCFVGKGQSIRRTTRRVDMGSRHFVQIEYDDAGNEVFRKEWSSQNFVKQCVYWKESNNKA